MPLRRLDALWGLSAFRALRPRPPAPRPTSATTWNSPSLPARSRLRARPTVFHGTGDLAFRDREGRWNLIVVADAQACPGAHRLRSGSPRRRPRARGLEPIARGWLVRHGPDGSADEEVVTGFDEREAQRAVAAWHQEQEDLRRARLLHPAQATVQIGRILDDPAAIR